MSNGNLIIKNAAQLVTCSGFTAKSGSEMAELHVIEDGALIAENGRILAVGRTADLLQGVDATGFTVIDAAGKAVLPGFVDSHTHFIFGGYRAEEYAWRLRGDSYMEIMQRGGGIISTVAATRGADLDELVASGRRRLDAMLAFGVTTVEGKSGYGLDRDTEIRQLEAMRVLSGCHPLDIVPTFLGAHAVPPEYKGREEAFIDFMMATVLPVVAERKLAEFCDIFCEKNVFSIEQSRRLLFKARALGLKLKLHADEIVPLGGAELAAELGAVSADHLLQASDRGIDDIARAGVIATLLPGTAFSLKEPYARARLMIDRGCAVALATDYQSRQLLYRVDSPHLRFGRSQHGDRYRGGADGDDHQRRRRPRSGRYHRQYRPRQAGRSHRSGISVLRLHPLPHRRQHGRKSDQKGRDCF